MDILTTYALNVWSVLQELAPWLLLGAAIAGALHGLVPRSVVRTHLTGPWGVLKSVVLGIPLPLCSCGVIPAGVGLKRDGASDGAAIGFLTATPQTGIDSLLVSASFLGWPFALAKVGAALVTGVGAGWLTDATAGPTGAEVEVELDDEPPPGWRGMLAHGVDIIREISGWLVFGILVSAAITSFVPPDAFGGLATQGALLAFGAVLIVSLPLYVCATASVPIAAALVAAGMPTGAAMVFLMAGPATNVATVGAVYRTFGLRTLAIYLGTVIVGSAAFGLGYEAVFGALDTGAVHHHEHTTWYGAAGSVVLIGLLASFWVQDLRGALARWQAERSPAPEVAIELHGLTCNGCAKKVERAIQGLEGVESAIVQFDDARALVKGRIDLDALRAAVAESGFEAGEARAV